jgi:ABC-2 type transport system permease protein
MKALISLFKVRFALTLQYRMTALAGFFTQFFFGFIAVMIFDAFFKSTDQAMPMSFAQTVTYIWLGQGFFHLLPWYGDRDVQLMIRNGDFAYEMLRPLDLYNYWYFKILAQRIAGSALRAVPLFITAALILPEPYSLGAPASLSAFMFFLISIISSILMGGTISNIITISSLYTIGSGIERLFTALVFILSGLDIPLSFFPDSMHLFLKIQPFSGLVDAPYKFYLGIYHSQDLIFTLLHQSVWAVIFIAAGQLLIAKAGRKIIVQGG